MEMCRVEYYRSTGLPYRMSYVTITYRCGVLAAMLLRPTSHRHHASALITSSPVLKRSLVRRLETHLLTSLVIFRKPEMPRSVRWSTIYLSPLDPRWWLTMTAYRQTRRGTIYTLGNGGIAAMIPFRPVDNSP